MEFGLNIIISVEESIVNAPRFTDPELTPESTRSRPGLDPEPTPESTRSRP
jgi:hypothetical protein